MAKRAQVVFITLDPEAAYLIAHSAHTYVIDPEERLRLLFPFGMSIEEMADDILQLMRR